MQRLRSERIVANPVDTSITAGRTKLPSVRATATMVLSGDQHGDIAPQPTDLPGSSPDPFSDPTPVIDPIPYGDPNPMTLPGPGGDPDSPGTPTPDIAPIPVDPPPFGDPMPHGDPGQIGDPEPYDPATANIPAAIPTDESAATAEYLP